MDIFGHKHLASPRTSLRTSLRTALRAGGALLGTGVLLALAGCGGGGSNNNSNPNRLNATLVSAKLVALTDSNQLLSFNSRTPSLSTTIPITGLTTGDSLRAIDYRYAFGVVSDNRTGLYAIGQFGTTQQLYLLTMEGPSATASRVGSRFSFVVTDPAATSFGFDFNPTVDRIRLVEPGANRDVRLNPNANANANASTSPVVDGDPATAGVQNDGPIAYAAGDVNAGNNPDAVGAAYTNSDADPTTGTTLFVLDSSLNTLTTQGRDANSNTGATAVSPNSGQLFTVAKLSIDIGEDTGFDIAPNGNVGFLSSANRIYSLSVTPGVGQGTVTGGARITPPTGTRIIGLAATP